MNKPNIFEDDFDKADHIGEIRRIHQPFILVKPITREEFQQQYPALRVNTAIEVPEQKSARQAKWRAEGGCKGTHRDVDWMHFTCYLCGADI